MSSENVASNGFVFTENKMKFQEALESAINIFEESINKATRDYGFEDNIPMISSRQGKIFKLSSSMTLRPQDICPQSH